MMDVRIKSSKIVTGGGITSGYIYIKDGVIADVSNEAKEASLIYDFGDSYVSAGFIEMHTHGGGGNSFLTSDPREIVSGANFHLSHGVTTILPTMTSSDNKTLRNSLFALKAAILSPELLPRIDGAHIEGPYFSPEMCGAQCPEFITDPIPEDYEEILRTFGGIVKRWSYAPERDKGNVFLHRLKECGIVPSIAHSAARYETVLSAFSDGAELVTHLYSCTSGLVREGGFRHLGIIETAYLLDGMFVEIIADGKHLPPELIRLILKIKGESRVALVTDSLPAAGTDITEGIISGTPFIIEDGVAKLRDRSAFAGSVATATVALRTLVNDVGVSIPSAVRMMTEVPAKILGIRRGSISVGYDADIAVFDGSFNVSSVFVRGAEVYKNNN